MRTVIAFTEQPLPSLADVGGKGLSLLRMAQSGLAVPPGVVLTTAFFEPWLASLRATPAWARFVDSTRGAMAGVVAACAELKATASTTLTLSAEQRAAATAALGAFPDSVQFAVRSSSPEEDLEGASFAGGYETVLGVTRETLEAAVLRAFVSCLDGRVASYKREHGFDPANPRIAVIVQRQIASEVAGVGLSLNPITNAYDEAVFNSNWGLGESVVAGRASPDLFIVDKVGRRILTKQVGKKETSFWLQPAGGTVERADPRHAELTLRDEQVLALADQLARIEALYGQPMDIEWAFAEGELSLLQARPMTAYVAIPPDLLTAPGAPKRLYFDVTLSVQGFSKPISAMGTSLLARLARRVSISLTGRDVTSNLDVAMGVARHGRLYGNLSRALAVVGKARLTRALQALDPLAAEALTTLDAATYARGGRPALRTLLHGPRLLSRALRAAWWPAAYRARVDARVAAHLASLPELGRQPKSIEALTLELYARTIDGVVLHLVPAIAAWMFTMGRLRRLFANPTEAEARWLGALDQSLPGNVTVEMGLALARVAKSNPTLEGVETSAEWLAFLETYGHRGPGELDVAEPRYRENPRLLLEQVRQLAQGTDDPGARYQRNQDLRREAVEALAAILRKRSRRLERRFRHGCAVVERLGGLRETPKYLLIKVVDLARSRLLAAAPALVSSGRLDRVEDIFDLDLADLDDPALDLRRRRAERLQPIEMLGRARELPRLVDSRGRIARGPPKELRPGELAGQPVSVGVARGPVKVLHTPDEKPLLQGDILVARATDPGWTPLFVNAAAVVLEIGGALQHGALVAREYGKPCVTGVEDATRRLQDGQWVEVDGAAGTIRLIEAPR